MKLRPLDVQNQYLINLLWAGSRVVSRTSRKRIDYLNHNFPCLRHGLYCSTGYSNKQYAVLSRGKKGCRSQESEKNPLAISGRACMLLGVRCYGSAGIHRLVGSHFILFWMFTSSRTKKTADVFSLPWIKSGEVILKISTLETQSLIHFFQVSVCPGLTLNIPKEILYPFAYVIFLSASLGKSKGGKFRVGGFRLLASLQCQEHG